MAEAVLGLDIGDRNIKAVAAARSIRGRIQVLYCAVQERKDNEDLRAAVAALFAEHPFLRHLPCITTLPAREVLFRNLTFPFRNRKKVEQTFKFELEAQLPLAEEELSVDFLTTDESDNSQILAAATTKTAVQSRTELIREFVRGISAMDVETVPLVPAFAAKQLSGGLAMVIDMGARHTVVLFIKNRRLIQLREFAFGTETASSEKDGTPAGMTVSSDAERFCVELYHTVEILKWRGLGEANPSWIYLTGG
ncbi:MAG: pilus assembly protein PilM, partial [Syntrophales bacterium]|nr:pilus assembly protein PilM [Syntrophales bacterium]